MSDTNSNTFSKLKQFFRMVKTGGTAGTIREHADFALVPELERELQPETPAPQRCAALRSLGEDVLTQRLDEAAIKRLWDLTKDLIVPHKPADQRQTALVFYQRLIQGQYKSLTMMRGHFYRVIECHDVAEDCAHRLELLRTLTEGGKDIKYFEESIGRFMLQWMPAVVEARVTEQFLEILVNIIKFNAAYLEKAVVVGIIQHACYLSSFGHEPRTVLQSLQVLDAALCYTVFPTETLTICIVALCRTVTELYCQTSWRIMKNLLGTNLGHVTLLTMCNILSDRDMYADETLLRGAVFHINMGLWGQTGAVVPMLRCSPATVLAAFRNALEAQRISVTFEVMLSVQRLIRLKAGDLSEPAWDVICEIFGACGANLRVYERTSALPREHIVQQTFHETLTLIEQHVQRNDVAIDPAHFYALIEQCADARPVASVLQLIEYQTRQIAATRPGWLQAMAAFVERFYRMPAVAVRVRCVQALEQMMEANRAGYEEEILERVVLPQFGGVHLEADVQVRQSVARMCVEMARGCETKRCLELLDVVERLLSRPLVEFEGTRCVRADAEWVDVIVCVDKLVEMFGVKLYRLPSTHAIRVFHLLVGHLERQYKLGGLIEAGGSAVVVRRKIFDWMLRARANAGFYIGLPEAATQRVKFSTYLGLEVPNATQQQKQQQQQQQQEQPLETGADADAKSLTAIASPEPPKPEPLPAAQLSTISIRRGCQRIVEALKIEKDWSVVELILRELPRILQNRAILQGNDMDALAGTLIAMYHSKSLIETLRAPVGTAKPSLSEFNVQLLTTIAALIPYHQQLQPRTLKEMIEALHKGLFLRQPRVCVNALTVMLLETPDQLLRQLPDVLLQMSKMSSTMAVAVPVLEFLSTLNRLPSHRFVNLIVLHYMYVFAISVPYTNPYKFDHYIVSLAHHVIAGWFLKCRLPLRRNFVNYIIKGFETNVQIPFQEGARRMDFAVAAAAVNEDSSNRKRSSSLTEQGSRSRGATAGGGGGRSERPLLQTQLQAAQKQAAQAQAAHQQHQQQQQRAQRPPQQDALYQFHMELAETCIDFLARHTFSPCSALPKRLPAAEFILAGGQQQTWLVGHNLITITTSGCTASASAGGQLKMGLCDRCSLMCSRLGAGALEQGGSRGGSPRAGAAQQQDAAASAAAASAAAAAVAAANKRYTKASLQHAGGQDSSTSSTDVTSSISTAAQSSGDGGHNTSTASTNSSSAAISPFSAQSAAGHTKFFRQSSTSNADSGGGGGGLRFAGSSSASGSLEALTRRGSHPDQLDSGMAAGMMDSSSVGSVSTGPRLSQSSLVTSPQRGHANAAAATAAGAGAGGKSAVCACSCTGWAEICIRRPTGNMSWVMRLQNQIQLEPGAAAVESVLHDIIGLFMPSLGGGVFGPDGALLSPDYDEAAVQSPPAAAGRPLIPDTSVTEASPPTPPPTSATSTSTASASVTPTSSQPSPSPIVRSVSVNTTPQSVGSASLDSPKSQASQTAAGSQLPAAQQHPTTPKSILKSDSSSSASTSTGPINIPSATASRMTSQDTKASAGSFSDDDDGDGGDDDRNVAKADAQRSDSDGGDAGDARRNPVRRVNSSPEMSSSYRNPIRQKSAPTAADHLSVEANAPVAADPVVVAVVAGATAVADVDQQRKKPPGFGSTMRVSCEAIPEEIAGQTPPSLVGSVQEATAATVATAAATQQSATNQVTRAAAFATSSASFPADATVISPSGEATASTAAPKKQLSADDALHVAAVSIAPRATPEVVKLRLPMAVGDMLPKVTSKPPQSPQPLSPRLLARNAAHQVASLGAGQHSPAFLGNGGGGGGGGSIAGSPSYGGAGDNNGGNGNGDYNRARSKTISVVRGEHSAIAPADALKWPFRGGARSGISPSSVFLQLYHTGPHGPAAEQPIQIGPHNKAIALLDLIPPFETHKIGVLYVGVGQCNSELEMFRNRCGSVRYTEFLRGLGQLVALRDAKEQQMFVPMDTNGRDGKFTYIWQDDIVQVTFHVATLMPNRESDPQATEKKKHIGNDFVTIVYNESGEEYDMRTIKGQFNYACVVVEPLELNTNRVFVRVKEDVAKYVNHAEPRILSDASAPLYARQLALHANLASLVAQSLKSKNQGPYASNWLERLRKIKHLRSKLLKENSASALGGAAAAPGEAPITVTLAATGGGGSTTALSALGAVGPGGIGGSGVSTGAIGAAGLGGGAASTATGVAVQGAQAAGAVTAAAAAAAASPWLREDFTAYTH